MIFCLFIWLPSLHALFLYSIASISYLFNYFWIFRLFYGTCYFLYRINKSTIKNGELFCQSFHWVIKQKAQIQPLFFVGFGIFMLVRALHKTVKRLWRCVLFPTSKIPQPTELQKWSFLRPRHRNTSPAHALVALLDVMTVFASSVSIYKLRQGTAKMPCRNFYLLLFSFHSWNARCPSSVS